MNHRPTRGLRPSAPPRSAAELLARARALTGRTLDEVAAALGAPPPRAGLRGKGKAGQLLEAALGATAGSAAAPDFPDLGVELKTIPVDERGKPVESTFVCALSLADADRAEWRTSVARSKLACVLWVPIATQPNGPRTIGEPLLWRPTQAEERALADDFDEIVGRIGAGGVECVDARVGVCMQLRPKAATGRVRTLAFGPDGERLATVPRGFYLRASFTAALLAAPRRLDTPR